MAMAGLDGEFCGLTLMKAFNRPSIHTIIVELIMSVSQDALCASSLWLCKLKDFQLSILFKGFFSL
jgi:hypothetical protein